MTNSTNVQRIMGLRSNSFAATVKFLIEFGLGVGVDRADFGGTRGSGDAQAE
jgi:hypothetical protein